MKEWTLSLLGYAPSVLHSFSHHGSLQRRITTPISEKGPEAQSIEVACLKTSVLSAIAYSLLERLRGLWPPSGRLALPTAMNLIAHHISQRREACP